MGWDEMEGGSKEERRKGLGGGRVRLLRFEVDFYLTGLSLTD